MAAAAVIPARLCFAPATPPPSTPCSQNAASPSPSFDAAHIDYKQGTDGEMRVAEETTGGRLCRRYMHARGDECNLRTLYVAIYNFNHEAK